MTTSSPELAPRGHGLPVQPESAQRRDVARPVRGGGRRRRPTCCGCAHGTRTRCGWRMRSAGSSSWPARPRPRSNRSPPSIEVLTLGLDCGARAYHRRPSTWHRHSRPRRARSPPAGGRTWTLVAGRGARQHGAHRRGHGRDDRRQRPRRRRRCAGASGRRRRPRGGAVVPPISAAHGPPRAPARARGRVRHRGRRRGRGDSRGHRDVAAAAAASGSLLIGFGNSVQPAVAVRGGRPLPATRGGPRRSGSSSGARRSAPIIGPNLVAPAGSWPRTSACPSSPGPIFVPIVFVGAAAILSCDAPAARSVRARRRDVAARSGGGRVASPSSLDPSLRRPHVPVAIVALVAGQFVMVLIMTMTPLHMTEHGHTLGAVGLVISGHTFGMFALSPMSGRLTDRFGSVPVICAGLVVIAGRPGPRRAPRRPKAARSCSSPCSCSASAGTWATSRASAMLTDGPVARRADPAPGRDRRADLEHGGGGQPRLGRRSWRPPGSRRSACIGAALVVVPARCSRWRAGATLSPRGT